MHQLQVALDILGLEEALAICGQVADWVDHLEVGTPLIKSVGIKAVAAVREQHPEMFIVADMKTIDTGDVDSRMAIDAGADAVIVQASAPRQTVRAVVEEVRSHGKKCMIDSLGINDMIRFERIAESSGADFAVVHTGIDEQRDGFRPLERLKRVVGSAGLPRLAVAGGIGLASIEAILDVLPTGVIIVGGSLTRAEAPGRVAKALREAVERAA